MDKPDEIGGIKVGDRISHTCSNVLKGTVIDFVPSGYNLLVREDGGRVTPYASANARKLMSPLDALQALEDMGGLGYKAHQMIRAALDAAQR